MVMKVMRNRMKVWKNRRRYCLNSFLLRLRIFIELQYTVLFFCAESIETSYNLVKIIFLHLLLN